MLKLRWLISCIVLIIVLLGTTLPVQAADAPVVQQDPQSAQATFSSIALLNFYANSLDYIIQLNRTATDANLAVMPFANVPPELDTVTNDFANNGMALAESLIDLFVLWTKQNAYLQQYRLNDVATTFKQITDLLPAARQQLSQIEASVADTGNYLNIGALPSDNGLTLVYNEITAKVQQLSGMLDTLNRSPFPDQLMVALKPTTLIMAINQQTAYVGDEIPFTGSLFSQGQPLSNREISLLLNNTNLLIIQTDAQGQFHGTFPIPYLYINQMPVQAIYYPKGNDLGIYLGTSSPVIDMTVLYYTAQLSLQLNDTAYPGRELVIAGTFDYRDSPVVTQRTAEFYIDNKIEKQIEVYPAFNQGVLLDTQITEGKHLVTVSVPADGRYAPVIASFTLNVALATTNLEVHLPAFGWIPGSLLMRGKAYSSIGPLSNGTIIIKVGSGSKQIITATDGTFNGKIGIGMGFSLLGSQGITLQVRPQEPWNASLTSTKNFFLINYFNFALILIVLVALVFYLPRRFKNWFKDLPRKPTKIPGMVLPERTAGYTQKADIAPKIKESYDKEETANSVLYWYRIALKLVQTVTKVIIKPQQTLREYGKEASPALGPLGRYFLELTYLLEKRLYSKLPPDAGDVEKSRQLVIEIQKETGHEK